MYIRLTRLDNSPIWINATFVVTIEPRKGGGSVVVPVGDGLDYDVRESPEQVLAMLDGAPEPKVIPIPTTDALKKAPVTSGPDNVNQLAAEARQTPSEHKVNEPPDKTEMPSDNTNAPSDKTETPSDNGRAGAPRPPLPNENIDVFADGASVDRPQPDEPLAATAETTPAKKTRKTATAKKPRAPRKAKKPPMPMPDDQVERLKKMGPKSLKKLQNTLFTQFQVADVGLTIEALAANGVLTVDGSKIVWNGES